MTRRRFIQVENGDLVEVTSDYSISNTPNDSGILWGDRGYTDLRGPGGVDISTRTKHRQFMKQMGLTTVDDFQGEWGKARQRRDDLFTTGGDHKERRQQVERAIYELNRRK